MADGKLSTQVGGPYGPHNPKLLAVRRALLGAGYVVRHPISDTIVRHEDRWRAVDSSGDAPPFAETETAYYNAIRDCDFHMVANFKEGAPGYVGPSSGAEIGYAMLHSKPVILIAPADWSAVENQELRSILERNQRHLHVAEFGESGFAAPLWREGFRGPTTYDLEVNDDGVVMGAVGEILASIRQT